MEEIDVVLSCPYQSLLKEPWDVIAHDILRSRTQKQFISNVITMAKCLGEINRHYSKNLPDKYVLILQKRCTELRKIVRKVSAKRREQGKEDLIPWQHLEYLFSDGDRKEMKR